MSEQDTRRQLIDPKLREAGWEVVEGSKSLQKDTLLMVVLPKQEGRRNPVMTMF